MRRKRLWLAALLLLGLVVSLPLLLNLEILRGPVHRALERQLGRKVEFASLSARLLPWPGLEGRGVVVFEQEDFGAEPFLFAEEVHCHLSPRLLRTGRLEFSEIYFIRPSVNLVRNTRHDWNVGAFLVGRASTSGSGGIAVRVTPVISATGGRINFKLGPDKQNYALTAARLRLEPQPDGRWRVQLEATPFRGDRRLTETGAVRLQGEIGRGAEFSAVPFRLQVGLDQGSLAQLVTLLTGRDFPLRGRMSLAATLEGTPADWEAEGALTVAALHHRDFLPPPRSPRWVADFKLGVAEGGAVEIEKAALRARESELMVAGRVDDLLGTPRWTAQVTAERLSLDELMTQWAGLSGGIPAETRLDGMARLALSVRGAFEGWQGELTAPAGVTLKASGLDTPVRLTGLALRLNRGRLGLAPLAFEFAPEESLTLDADWRLLAPDRPYRLHWRSRQVELNRLQEVAAALGWEFLGPARWQGEARLDLSWRGDSIPGTKLRWEGRAELRGASVQFPELSQPLNIPEARLEWTRNRLRVAPLVVKLGEIPVTGTLERQGTPGRWDANLAAGQLRLAALAGLFASADRGLLARLVQSETRRAPQWDDLVAAGTVRVEELAAGPFRFHQVQVQGRWQEARLEVTRLRFRAYGGRFEGRLQADFGPAPPQYRLAGNLKQVDLARLLADSTDLGVLFSGMAGADLSLQSAGGNSEELRRRLQGWVVGVVSNGAIKHVNLLAAMANAAGLEPGQGATTPATELQSLAGEFRLADGQVSLDGVRMIVDGAALELSGRTRFDGTLDLRMSGEPLRVARRLGAPAPGATARLLAPTYRLTGSLRRPRVEVAEPAPAPEDATSSPKP